MSRSSTPTFRIESTGANTVLPMTWSTKDMGRPSPANIEKMVAHYMASCKPGGCNARMAEDGMVVWMPLSVRVIRQAGSEIVAEWVAPMFSINETNS